MADTNGICFDIDGLFDFDEDKYEEVVNEDVYEIVSYNNQLIKQSLPLQHLN